MSEKKRSTYRPGNRLDFPVWAEADKKNKYRWISAENLAAMSDGYESRGWVVAKQPGTDMPVRRLDLILGVMPMDKWLEVKKYNDELKEDQMRLFLDNQSAEIDQATHEFKKAGGKIRFKFEQN